MDVRAAENAIRRVLLTGGPDEIRVLGLVAERLTQGRRQHGELRLDRSAEGFQREALEHAGDALVDVAAALVLGQSAPVQTEPREQRLVAAERGADD